MNLFELSLKLRVLAANHMADLSYEEFAALRIASNALEDLSRGIAVADLTESLED